MKETSLQSWILFLKYSTSKENYPTLFNFTNTSYSILCFVLVRRFSVLSWFVILISVSWTDPVQDTEIKISDPSSNSGFVCGLNFCRNAFWKGMDQSRLLISSRLNSSVNYASLSEGKAEKPTIGETNKKPLPTPWSLRWLSKKKTDCTKFYVKINLILMNIIIYNTHFGLTRAFEGRTNLCLRRAFSFSNHQEKSNKMLENAWTHQRYHSPINPSSFLHDSNQLWGLPGDPNRKPEYVSQCT